MRSPPLIPLLGEGDNKSDNAPSLFLPSLKRHYPQNHRKNITHADLEKFRTDHDERNDDSYDDANFIEKVSQRCMMKGNEFDCRDDGSVGSGTDFNHQRQKHIPLIPLLMENNSLNNATEDHALTLLSIAKKKKLLCHQHHHTGGNKETLNQNNNDDDHPYYYNKDKKKQI
mmetsp:Transcript_36967/g.42166  ORF Transcript_36967/g.42166 Transcript_36967/m.42166 type:complete len:171 (-) Transcript_36967:141-653(-)